MCNGKCVICPYETSWHARNPGVMTDRLFSVIIDQIKDINTEKICPYLENEPLMDSKIFERIAIIRDSCTYGHIEVATNALLLTRSRSQRLLESLAGSAHEVWISFHGINKETYEEVMHIPFETAYHNVIDFLRLCEEASPQTKVVIRGAGLPKLKKWTKKRFFGKAEYERFWSDTLEKHGSRFRPEIEFFLYHDRAANVTDPSLAFRKRPRRDLSSIRCPRVERWLHFLYNGDMVLCCMDYHRETVFGNIESAPLKEILDGQPYNKLKGQASGQLPAPDNFICRRCFSPNG